MNVLILSVISRSSTTRVVFTITLRSIWQTTMDKGSKDVNMGSLLLNTLKSDPSFSERRHGRSYEPSYRDKNHQAGTLTSSDLFHFVWCMLKTPDHQFVRRSGK